MATRFAEIFETETKLSLRSEPNAATGRPAIVEAAKINKLVRMCLVILTRDLRPFVLEGAGAVTDSAR
ncbi:MAG: hypothetical protein ACXW20_02810 [Burkholderiales bacterium]